MNRRQDAQAYIATAVALGALLVAAFAAPALTNASLPAPAAEPALFDDADDVLRVLALHLDGLAINATSDCEQVTQAIPVPGEPGNFTTITTWTCEPGPCGAGELPAAANATIAALAPYTQASLRGHARLLPGCEARCLGGTHDSLEQIPTNQPMAQLRLRLWLQDVHAEAAFNVTTQHAVHVTCV